MRLRDGIFAAGVALAVSAMSMMPALDALRGLSLDTLFWLRHQTFGQRHDPATSPVVVVAIDEETMRRAPFADIPTALWTREIARVLTAVVEGGAAAVGFDVIFSTSAERFAPGWDRDFLLALRSAARQDKVLLGKVQHQAMPIRPFQSQSFAVGNERNIRSNNLLGDADEIIRRVPLTFEAATTTGGSRTETSMSLELAARTARVQPVPSPAGVALGSYLIPNSRDNELFANFDGGNDIPTFSLADLLACADGGNREFFRKHFEGKAVLLGSVLDIEDRKLTSKRFITAPDNSAFARCVHEPMRLVRSDVVRDTIPGVYIHATAVANLLRGDALAPVPPVRAFFVSLALALGAGAAGILLPPIAAALVILGGLVMYAAAAVVLFHGGIVVPLLPPVFGAGVVFAIELAYRFMVADKDKRFLRRSFSLYLAPAEVERMLKAEKAPQLGGESRNVTIMFSDVAGFTGLSEILSPAELVALMNEYLSAMTDIVEAHRGFVDNFIGDAIMAVFGAPVEDPDHPLHAVQCALACRAKLAELNRASPGFVGRQLHARIGVNSGDVLVGNIGSRRRLKYTVMGDPVNLASRLEGANKSYGTSILVAEDTVAAIGHRIEWREIDRVRVKGRRAPVTIYEPLGPIGEAPSTALDDFAAALAAYRDGRFAEAAAMFARLAPTDAAAAMFAERARSLAVAPPEAWEAVTVLETK